MRPIKRTNWFGNETRRIDQPINDYDHLKTIFYCYCLSKCCYSDKKKNGAKITPIEQLLFTRLVLIGYLFAVSKRVLLVQPPIHSHSSNHINTLKTTCNYSFNIISVYILSDSDLTRAKTRRERIWMEAFSCFHLKHWPPRIIDTYTSVVVSLDIAN